MKAPAVKICCIATAAEADLAVAAGAAVLGLVTHMPSGPGVISDEARAAAPFVDALLLDSGNPLAPVKELGGTGRRHDWATSRRIRDAVWPLPLFLAGGLNAGNVAEAITTVQPHGLDLCSSVRSGGALDAARLADFFAAVAGAAATESPA